MNNDLISRESLGEKIRAMQNEAHQRVIDAGRNDDRMGAEIWHMTYKLWEEAYSMVMQEPIVKNGERSNG